MTVYRSIDAKKLRESIEENLRRSFGKGGETHCSNDSSEIIYGGVRPEHASPRPYTSPRETIGSMTYRNNDGTWMEGGYCPECEFTTQRPVTGRKLRGIEKRWNRPRDRAYD